MVLEILSNEGCKKANFGRLRINAIYYIESILNDLFERLVLI